MSGKKNPSPVQAPRQAQQPWTVLNRRNLIKKVRHVEECVQMPMERGPDLYRLSAHDFPSSLSIPGHDPAFCTGLCLLPVDFRAPLLGSAEPLQPADGEARGCFGGIQPLPPLPWLRAAWGDAAAGPGPRCLPPGPSGPGGGGGGGGGGGSGNCGGSERRESSADR
ncbi:dual specificity protein phosphatase 8-like isoform X1 [Sus scrofa]|uniref:dual specificity protein phosphatase 8-like isoform X1 n=1 Tax=Sus scrofa TaxID=9823 RepID=UPI000A2B1EA9|nr:dual specificity protein phosphatase 8-like isoform X1 [Sus scrofa]